MNRSNTLDAASQDEGLVNFNAGNELFTICSSIILESDSTVLSNLVNSKICQDTQQNPIFIDRNGELFCDNIFYMITGQIYAKDLKKLRVLNEEAAYYEFDSMTDALEESMNAARIQQEKWQKKSTGKYIMFVVAIIAAY